MGLPVPARHNNKYWIMNLDKAIEEAQDGWCEYDGSIDDFIASHMKKLAHDLKKQTVPKYDVTHGNYHCGLDECCGKLTKSKMSEEKISDAYCMGYNQAIKEIKDKWNDLL